MGVFWRFSLFLVVVNDNIINFQRKIQRLVTKICLTKSGGYHMDFEKSSWVTAWKLQDHKSTNWNSPKLYKVVFYKLPILLGGSLANFPSFCPILSVFISFSFASFFL